MPCLAGLALAGVWVRAQQSPPTFSSGVELITVDAVVVDSHGQPVAGLTRDDFVLKEDGEPQQIASFEAFEAQAAPAEPTLPTVVASNEGGVRRAGRSFALIVDDTRMSQADAVDARRAVATFLERSLRDGDEVSLGTSSAEARWSARLPEGREDLAAVASRIQGLDNEPPTLGAMSDYEAFWIDGYESSGGRITERVVARWTRTLVCFERDPGCPGMVRGRARSIEANRAARTRVTLQALRRGLEALAPTRGRKSMILFSRGFLEDSGTDVRDVVAAAREVNAAVYFVDVRGLVAQPGLPSAADSGGAAAPGEVGAQALEAGVLESGGAQNLADETGGFTVRNTNDLAAGAERVAAESRVFYLLGFHPTPGKSVANWRKLRVEVKRPGLTVRARRGYTLRASPGAQPTKPNAMGKDAAKASVNPAVSRALGSAHDEADIPLRVQAYVFGPRPNDTAHVLVAVELDVARIALTPKGKARLDVSVVASHRDSGRGFRHDDALEVAAGGPEPAGWRGFTREFELPPGVSQVRVVVRDPTNGALGSVSQRLEVPLAREFRITTPIVSDRLAPKQEGQARPQPALAVHRVFRPEGQLYCQYEVLGAARASGQGLPRVVAGLELRAADGAVVRKAEPTPVAPDPDGRLVRLIGLGLDGLAEGSYELVLQVRDELSALRVERREPFTLTR